MSERENRPDPSAFTDEENWHGGCYELAVELGDTSDERLLRALAALWQAAGIDGCHVRRDREPADQESVPLTVASLTEHGHLRGTVVLPSGHRVVCCCVAVREEDGPDWLDLCLPVGALARTDRRLGAFPFGPDGGEKSLRWRRPIDDWLAGVGVEVFRAAPYRLGLIGAEVSGLAYARDLDGAAPAERWAGYLLPDGETVRFAPANR